MTSRRCRLARPLTALTRRSFRYRHARLLGLAWFDAAEDERAWEQIRQYKRSWGWARWNQQSGETSWSTGGWATPSPEPDGGAWGGGGWGGGGWSDVQEGGDVQEGRDVQEGGEGSGGRESGGWSDSADQATLASSGNSAAADTQAPA